MKFEQFDLERNQSLFEHKVDFNLSESGVHPLKLTEILSKAELENLLELQLSYGHTNGTKTLRKLVSNMYESNISLPRTLLLCLSAIQLHKTPSAIHN